MNTSPPATMSPAPPLRGETVPARQEAAVRIVIPGRPQARPGNAGERTGQAAAYLDAVRAAAREHGLGRRGHPLVPHGHVHVDLLMVYTSDENLPPTSWPAQSIPNADTAATLVLKALTGLAWTHATQVNPLVTTRRVITPAESRSLYGSVHGATVITIGA